MVQRSVLSSEAAHNYVRTSIAMSEWETKSGASILRSLKEGGIGIREQDFYAIRREVLGLKRFEEQVKRLRPDTRVPVAWIDEAPGWHLKSNFLYQARVYGHDPKTGEEIERFFATSSKQELTREIAENAILSSLVGEEDFYAVIPDRVELFHVYHSVGYQFTY